MNYMYSGSLAAERIMEFNLDLLSFEKPHVCQPRSPGYSQHENIVINTMCIEDASMLNIAMVIIF